MKNVYGIVAGAALVGLAVWGTLQYLVDSQERRQSAASEAASRASKEEAIKESVLSLARSQGADTAWPRVLAGGEDSRWSAVQPAELQEAWGGQKPFLFIGHMETIATGSADTRLRMTVTYDSFSQRYSFDSTKIQLTVECDRATLLPILRAVSKPNYMGELGDVAVVARLASVVAGAKVADELRRTITATGDCLAAMHLPEGVKL